MQTAELISNINDLYKPPLNQGQQGFYRQFLHRYTVNQLDELWSLTMESHCRMSAPTIGELKKYGKDVTRVKVVRAANEKDKITDEEVFATKLGQQSLRQGWANSYLLACREDKIPPQTDETVLKFQLGQHNAREAVRKLEEEDRTPYTKAYLSFWRVMKERNEELRERFG